MSKRYMSLDAVRALAALSVLVTHWSGWFCASVPDAFSRLVSSWDLLFAKVFWAAGGLHPGVVVFIVLSGFCIHLPQARRPQCLDEPRFWQQYARRRVLRIGPVYWVGVVAGAVGLMAAAQASVVPPPYSDAAWTVTGLVGRLALLNAFRPWEDVGNGPLDTVAAEAILYAGYPLLLMLRRAGGWRAVFALSTLLHIAAAAGLAMGLDASWIGASALTFHLYWAFGALAAERFVGSQSNVSRWTRCRAVIPFAVYLGSSSVLRMRGAHLVNTAILAAFAAVLLHDMMKHEERLEKHGLGLRVLRGLGWLGERSYSLYAIHVPVLVIAWIVLGWMQVGASVSRGVILGAVFVAAVIVYECVERPSHRWARSGPRKQGNPAGVVSA
jgi:peptidoglycan/LPS O-acetylase OafA/YrhL